MSHTMVSSTPLFSNKAYDVLRWISFVVLPASGALYFGLSDIWNLPYALQVVGTTTVIDTFLGAILGVTNHNYKKSDARFDGSMTVDTRDPEKDVISFQLKNPVDELTERDSVELKVDTPPAE